MLMHTMETLGKTGLEELDGYEDIVDNFKRRASRKEFATVKFIVYLQFSLLVLKDPLLTDQLLRYGFDVLYPKLKWNDKAIGLEISTHIRASYKANLLDKIACEILRKDYEEIFQSDMRITTLI